MCMSDMTENEKNEILAACREMSNLKGFMSTIQVKQEALEIKNEHLKEKIHEEIQERKDEDEKMEKENRERFNKIDGKFEVIFSKLGNIHKRIDAVFTDLSTKIENGIKQNNNWLKTMFTTIILFIITNILNGIFKWW